MFRRPLTRCFRFGVGAALLVLTTACGSSSFGPFFKITVKISASGTGSGTVTSTDPAVAITCTISDGVAGSGCEDSFNEAGAGGSFILTALENAPSGGPGSVFTSWSGCSVANLATCTLSFSPAAGDTTFNVTATFSPESDTATITITLAGSGVGNVRSQGEGQPGSSPFDNLNCGLGQSRCSATGHVRFLNVVGGRRPERILFIAQPGAASTFASWSGDCSEANTVFEPRSFIDVRGRNYVCVATFDLDLAPPPVACSGATRIWNGDVSDDWSNPSNWDPNGVPGQNDDVCVPSQNRAPRLTANATVRNLVGLDFTSLSGFFDLDIHGNLNWAGTTAGNFGAVRLVGASGTVQGTMTPLTVMGDYTVTGRLTVATLLKIVPGQLTLGGNTVSVGQLEVGPINALGTGRLVMTNQRDSLLSTGSVFFNSDEDHNLLLTDGVLRVGGNFTQLFGAPFAASGVHRTVFTTGTLSQTVLLFVPQAHFGHLDVSAAGTLNFDSDAMVQGQLIATPQAATPSLAHTSAGVRLLTVGGVNVTRLNLSRLGLIINGGNVTAFRNVTFTGFQNLGFTQLEVRHPGQAAPFGFDNLTFADVPTAGGFYLAAYDTDPTTPPLTINVTNSSPASGAPYVLTSNGAVVNW